MNSVTNATIKSNTNVMFNSRFLPLFGSCLHSCYKYHYNYYAEILWRACFFRNQYYVVSFNFLPIVFGIYFGHVIAAAAATVVLMLLQ